MGCVSHPPAKFAPRLIDNRNTARFSGHSPKGSKNTSSLEAHENTTNHSNSENVGPKHQPLSLLPLRMILRSLATSTVSSSPKLLAISLPLLRFLAYNDYKLFNPDHNPVLRYTLNKSLYEQFCAGEDAEDVAKTVAGVKDIGFTGAILAYAKETPTEPDEYDSRDSRIQTDSNKKADKEISYWLENSLETVRLARTGDFVALKFTGAGSLAYDQLREGSPPGPYLDESIDRVCQFARDRGVRVLIDGEHDELQGTIDDWTLQLAERHNKVAGKTIVYGTYQAYKKTMPEVLVGHLEAARDRNFTLGVKLVRGAYLHSDPPGRLQDSKPDTDACYDSAAASALTREWNSTLSGSGRYPEVSIMLATHNATSVRKAYSIYAAGRARSELLFAQLQGMADQISCELVKMNSGRSSEALSTPSDTFLPVYKYMAWGTTGECMKYLLRRAEENRDAVARTKEDRNAMWHELMRRVKALFRPA